MDWLLDWRAYVTTVCAETFITYFRVTVFAPNVLVADVFRNAIIH